MLKKTDRWYFQPKRLGIKTVGHPLIKQQTDTLVKTYSDNLDDNTMVILAIKGHNLTTNVSMSDEMLDNYFEKGIFLIGTMGNGKPYVD